MWRVTTVSNGTTRLLVQLDGGHGGSLKPHRGLVVDCIDSSCKLFVSCAAFYGTYARLASDEIYANTSASPAEDRHGAGADEGELG
eukprot:scaffold185025_cov43-Prasinocladus_malaysianus.AAC.1